MELHSTDPFSQRLRRGVLAIRVGADRCYSAREPGILFGLLALNGDGDHNDF